MSDFKKIKISDKAKIEEYLDLFNSQVSELNFTNIFSWREKYGFEFSVIDDFLWILNRTADGRVFFSPPIGDYKKSLIKSIEKVKEYCVNKNIEFVIKKASEEVKNQIIDEKKFKYEVSSNRDASDYLYLFDDLLELKGNMFHKKKNRVNKFKKTYEQWSYEKIESNNIEDCKTFADQWCDDNSCETIENLQYEREAIEEVFDNYEVLNCQGGVIRVNGEIAGFTISEYLNDNTIVIHFEKADTKYSGIYNILGNEHLKHLNNKATYINREQDLGIPGLRRSKLSYHPIRLIHKYKIRII